MKILAIKCRRLGDTVLWTAALEALQQCFPSAQIDLAFPKAYAPLFDGDTRFKTRYGIESDRASQKRLSELWRANQYDTALVFHASPSSRRLGKSASAKHLLIHHHSRTPRNFGSAQRIVGLGKPMAATERDLNVVRTLGWTGASPSPKLVTSAPRAKKWIVFSPAASRPSKQWELERYGEVIAKLPTHVPAVVVSESEDLWRNRARLRRQIEARAQVLITKTLSQAIQALSLARCFVGADSGLKHMAAALGVPTITLFGPESLGEWHPYSPDSHTAIQKEVRCRTNDADNPAFAWCGAAVCPLASHACLSQTQPEEVLRAIERYL